MNSETTPILVDSKQTDTNQNESYEENLDLKRQKKKRNGKICSRNRIKK